MAISPAATSREVGMFEREMDSVDSEITDCELPNAKRISEPYEEPNQRGKYIALQRR